MIFVEVSLRETGALAQRVLLGNWWLPQTASLREATALAERVLHLGRAGLVMSNRLQHKRCLIVGGTSGIGSSASDVASNDAPVAC